ncbi:MAG: hypothetical protein K2Q20_06265 [Phycisphaerales bacterium]|nr:hypothetical protein [Phycisphaerales bacterium]
MFETLEIFVVPQKDKRAFNKWLKELESKGYKVDRDYWKSLHDAVNVDIPVDSPDDLEPFKQAAEDGIIKRWRRSQIKQHFTQSEIASAPLFGFVYVGRDMRVPQGKDLVAGISHFVEYDTSFACVTCGAWAKQCGPLRILGSELNQAARLSNITIVSNSFDLVPAKTLEQISQVVKAKLPLRPIEVAGKVKLKEEWWQLDPDFELPIEVCQEMRYVRIVCQACGVVRLDGVPGDELLGGYFTVKSAKLRQYDLPPAMLEPYWNGDIKRYQDGRLISTPSRRIWLRGDVGRALLKLKIRGLSLSPILAV